MDRAACTEYKYRRSQSGMKNGLDNTTHDGCSQQKKHKTSLLIAICSCTGALSTTIDQHIGEKHTRHDAAVVGHPFDLVVPSGCLLGHGAETTLVQGQVCYTRRWCAPT